MLKEEITWNIFEIKEANRENPSELRCVISSSSKLMRLVGKADWGEVETKAQLKRKRERKKIIVS